MNRSLVTVNLPLSLRSQSLRAPSATSLSSSRNSRWIISLLDLLTPVQRRFVEDPSRYKLARATRRAGKSYADAVYLIIECLKRHRTPVLYAGLTRDSAKEAVWDMLIEILESLDIEHTPRESSLMIEFDNGSKITLFGCDMNNARNRLRGRKFKLVIFDETGFFAAIDPIVYVVIPMLADFGGTLVMTSSPGELLTGLFYEADQGKLKDKWSRYFWSIWDNPIFLQPALDLTRFKLRADEELANVLENTFGGNEKAAGYRREWLGEWVQDDTALCYPITAKNLLTKAYKMPEQYHGIGIDLGSPTNSSLSVGRYSPFKREFQIVKSWSILDMPLDDFARAIEREMDVYKATFIVANVGDFSKEIVDELRRRYSLPIIASDKKDRPFHQKIFANDLSSSFIQVVEPSCSQLIEECAKIVKSADNEEIPGQLNSCANSSLVLYKRAYQTVLQGYQKPLTLEEIHIKQLEERRFIEPLEFWERDYDGGSSEG